MTGSGGSRVRLLDRADWAWRSAGPSPRAVRAFGVRVEDLRPMPRGTHTWTDGRLFLKAVGCVPEHDWVCGVYAGWTATRVRVAEPVAPSGAGESGWSSDGWGAQVFIRGGDAHDHQTIRAASDAFHDSVRDLPRPGFLDDRDDPWSFGDRLAWEDVEPMGDDATLALIERLRGHLAPVAEPPQVIHGDILPNVMVDGGVPVVIDWPPYHRPRGLANAIAATDAVTFDRAPLSALDEWGSGPDWDQLLIRALLYRLGPTAVFAAHNRLRGVLTTHAERVAAVVDAIVARGRE